MFPGESLNGFLTDFSCLSVFTFEWEIILTAGHTFLYVLYMMKKQDLKNRQNQPRDDHTHTQNLNETNYSFKSKVKTVNWASCHRQGTGCSSWKQVTREVNLRAVIWTEEIPMLATLFYREQIELLGLYL